MDDEAALMNDMDHVVKEVHAVLENAAIHVTEQQAQYIVRLAVRAARLNESHDDADYHLAALERTENALRRVPPEMWKRIDFCYKAVKARGEALEWVSKSVMDNELCFAAVLHDPWSIEFVPDKFRTTALYLAAVKQDGFLLRLVPPNSMTREIMREALTQNPQSQSLLPEDWKEEAREFLGEKA